MMENKYTIGIDFGTDSVRSVVVDTATGEEAGSAVFEYPRWKRALYCDPSKNQFRQHPLGLPRGWVYHQGGTASGLRPWQGRMQGFRSILPDPAGCCR